MAKKDYNSINFKNRDIDRFAGKFGQGDPQGDPIGYQKQKTVRGEVSKTAKSGAKSMAEAYNKGLTKKMSTMTDQEKNKLANKAAQKTAEKIYEADGGKENPTLYNIQNKLQYYSGMPTNREYMERKAKGTYDKVMNVGKPKK
jgi:hypothetical protein